MLMNKAVKNPRLHGVYMLVKKDRQLTTTKKSNIKKQPFEDFPANPLLRLHAPNAGGTVSIPRWETKILSATHNTEKIIIKNV